MRLRDQLLEELDKLLIPPKFLPDMEGKDCFMCGHPMPNSRGAELLKDFVSSSLQRMGRMMLEAVPEYTEGDGWERFFGREKTDTCCPGDDVADGYNHARKNLRQALLDNGVDVG